MATDVEKLVAQLVVRQREFEREMERAVRTTRRKTGEINRRFAQTNKSATAQMASMGRGIFAALGPVLGAGTALTGGALIAGIRSSVSELSALGKQARTAGLDVEELQGLVRGFARSTTASESQIITAFADFNQRVGEAATGTGELAAMAKRYGFSVTDANGRLKSQSELLREISEIMRRLPNQQERTALAVKAMGEGGRLIAVELAKGPENLARMQTEAEAAGNVLDRDLIQRAEILDDKFDDLTRRAETFFKTVALGMVGQAAETPADVLARVFGGLDRARALLGEGLVEALTADLGVIDGLQTDLGALAQDFAGLGQEARMISGDMLGLADSLQSLGAGANARDMRALSDELITAAAALRDGEINADEFRDRLSETMREAVLVAEEVEGLDGASLAGIVGRFEALFRMIRSARLETQSLKAETGSPVDTPTSRRAGEVADQIARDATRAQAQAFIAEQERLRSLTVEQIELEREMDTLRRDASQAGVALTEAQIAAQAKLNLARQAELSPAGGSAGGSGGGGAASGGDEFTRAVAAIRERTAAMEMEAMSILATASAGRDYGDAMEFARQRAQLLLAAQKSGLAITPELEAAIDRLAAGYDRAGSAARDAAQKMTEAQSRARSGAQAITGLFMAMGEGSDQAKQALAGLLAQIAQAQMMQGLTSLFPGAMSFLGGLMGFSGGGYTGDGAKHQPKGVVHGGEYVFTKKAVQAVGVPQLDALHRRLQGFSQGGLVGAATGGRALPDAGGAGLRGLSISVGFDETMGAFRATVRDDTGQIVAQGIDYNNRRNLPGLIRDYQNDPRQRRS